ncbi:MAG: DUF3332 family protein [Planctomycetota bacterium]
MKKALLGAALAGVTLAGCLGPNKAFNGVHDWNREVTDNDILNELVFLGCTFVVPVYSVAYLVDIIVLNTIDYWTGDDSPMGE